MGPSPPGLAALLIRIGTRPGLEREDVLASMAEEWAERAESSRSSADRWYWRQSLGFVARSPGRLLQRGEGSAVVSTLMQDLKYAARSMRRSPAPYAIALLTIALGVGANTAMFSVVKGVILAPLPYPDADRLVRVWPEKRWSVGMTVAVQEGSNQFTDLGTALDGSLALVEDGQPVVLHGRQTTSGWFAVLGARPALGRLPNSSDDTHANGPVVVLSHRLWVSRFGSDPAVVGRTLRLSGYGVDRRTVIGVMSPDFQPYGSSPDVWFPLPTDQELPGFRGTYGGTTIARLAPGATASTAIADMKRLIPSIEPEHPSQFRPLRHSPVDAVGLKTALVGDTRSPLLVLLGAVTFVLLIGCTNVANLLLARMAHRRREVALRVALGADRMRVLAQMLTESAGLGLAGGAIGVMIAFASMPFLQTQLAAFVPRADSIHVDVAVLLYAVVVSILAGLAFGIAPGLRASSAPPAGVLNEHARGSVADRRSGVLNDALIVVEVALSLVLVAGAAMMVESLDRLGSVDTGMDVEGVAVVEILVPAGRYDESGARQALFTALLEQVGAVPGVQSAALANLVPMSGRWSGTPYTVPGEAGGSEATVAGFQVVTEGYFETFGVPLLEGRLLTRADASEAERVVVVDEGFARRHWPDQSAVGQMVLYPDGSENARIVGVVGATRFAGLQEEPRPSMYFSPDQTGWPVSRLFARTSGDPEAVVESLRDAIQAVDSELPIQSAATMSHTVAEATGESRFYTRLLGAFAILALFLGVVGVYGVTSYSVGGRIREMGVRLALGATSRTVMAQTMRRSVVPIAIGVAVGVVAALVGGGIMASMLYDVRPGDPTILGGVALLLLTVGVGAIAIPAFRALRLDPADALRTE